MKILIVDDEPLARERLYHLVQEIDQQYALLQAADGIEALAILQSEHIDLLLLDIRMPRMDGLELATHILKLDNPPAIVFTTAYQDHALSAFDANAIDYLLKPIRKERLQTALERAKRISISALTVVNQSSKQQRTHVSAMLNGEVQLIPIEDIYYFKAEQKYVTAAWPEGQVILDDSLTTLEEAFSESFVRIHRNRLVAKKQIHALCKNDEGQPCIKLNGLDEQLPISRRHLTEIKALLYELTHR